MEKRNNNPQRFVSRFGKELLLVLLGLIVLVVILIDSLSDKPAEVVKVPASDSVLFVGQYIIPQQVFCGDTLNMNDTIIRKRLVEEFAHITLKQPPELTLNRRASRWFPVVEPILKKYNVPDDFKYVMLIESGLINDPDQPKAGGFWQLMPPVAEHYGLEISNQVDERFNVLKATEAACKCINDAYEHYNSWPLAFASYDLGIGALDAQINKQDKDYYYHLDLTEETASYVYRILAFKAVITDPGHYGYELKPRSLLSPVPSKNVTIDSSVTSFRIFAEKMGTDLRSFKYLNPWLLDSALSNPDHKKYTFLIPPKGAIIYGMGDFDAERNRDSVPDSLPVKLDSGVKD